MTTREEEEEEEERVKKVANLLHVSFVPRLERDDDDDAFVQKRMKGFLSKRSGHGEDHRGVETTTTKKPKKKNQNNEDDDAADENTTNERQKRQQQEKTAQKIREKQARAIERSANSVRAISGLASGSMRLLPNKNGKKPISTKTNVQGMVVGLAALGVARSMAERSVVAKKKKKRKKMKKKRKERGAQQTGRR